LSFISSSSTSHCSNSIATTTQFFIALNSPGSTYAAGSRWHFRRLDQHFLNERGVTFGRRD
jgi:hypothetical protein